MAGNDRRAAGDDARVTRRPVVDAAASCAAGVVVGTTRRPVGLGRRRRGGILGTAWAVIGSTALAEFPDDRLFVGALWAAYAGGLGVAAMHSRRRGRSAY